MAEIDTFVISQRLEELTKSPSADTNRILQLQSAYAVAKENARLLSDDCRRRGHCDNHPWKTSWDSMKPALAGIE
jgi:hypothetical protein